MPRRPCDGCLELTDRYDQFEERIEWRRVHDQARYKTSIQRHLCKGCTDRAVRNARPVIDVPVQGELL